MKYPLKTKILYSGDDYTDSWEGTLIEYDRDNDQYRILWSDEIELEWYDEFEVTEIVEGKNTTVIFPQLLPEDLFHV